MKKRLLIGLAVLLLLAGVAVWLEPTGVVLGWLHGEAFYRNRPTRYWETALTDADPKRQVDAHQQLKDGGRAAVPVLAQLLRSGRVEARWRAADLLGQMRADARDAAPALVQALGDSDPHVRAVAATGLV
ncbi:MAG: HEAT repeat domain-containing protein, partial [Gemmataceae bacterium]